MKTNLEALKAVYVKNGGSLTDTYEDIAGGAPVSAYKTLKDAIAALSKLTLGGGGSGLPEVDPEDAGKIMVVSDEGEWELGSISEALPDVTAADDNKGMFVENGEWTLKDAPSIIIPSAPTEILNALTTYLSAHLTEIISANGAACYYPSITSLIRENAADTEAFDNFVDKVIECCKNISYPAYADYTLVTYRKYRTDSSYLYGKINYAYYLLSLGGTYNLKFEPIIEVAKNISGTGVAGQITYGAVAYYLPQPT